MNVSSDKEKHGYYYGQYVFCQETGLKKIISCYLHARSTLDN